jgi:hypothetical protein
MKNLTIDGNCLFIKNDASGLRLRGVENAWIAGNRTERNDQSGSGSPDVNLSADGAGNNCEAVSFVGNHFDGRNGPDLGIQGNGDDDTDIFFNKFLGFGTAAIDANSNDTRLGMNSYESVGNPRAIGGATRVRVNNLGTSSGAPTGSDWDPGNLVRDTSNGDTYLIKLDGTAVPI